MTLKVTKHMTHIQTQIYQHEKMYSTKKHHKKNQETPQKTTQRGKENRNTT